MCRQSSTNIRYSLFVTLISLIFLPALSSAKTVTFNITATISLVDDHENVLGGQISAGDTITGSYTYNDTTPDSNTLPTVGDYRHTSSPAGITLEVNGITFETDASNVDFIVELVDDHGNPSRDNYLLRSYNNITSASYFVEHISWQLDDPSTQALSSPDLSDQPPVLADWESPFGLTIRGCSAADASGGCDSNDYFIRAHVTSINAPSTNQPPIAAFSFNPANPAAGTPVAFTSTSSDPDGQIVAWEWDFGDGTTSDQEQPESHIYDKADQYPVTLTVTDNDGESTPIMQVVHVQESDLTMEVERTHAWANGHEKVQIIVRGAIPGNEIQLQADPSQQVTILPKQTIKANEDGEAVFDVTSTKVGPVVLTATDVEAPSLSTSGEVQFVERRVAVYVQGITTELDSNNELETFPEIREILTHSDLNYVRPVRGSAETGKACTNTKDDDKDGVPNDGCPLILNYSYEGGKADNKTGIWRPKKYKCTATSNSLLDSIEELRKMLVGFSKENPNTRFALIGHSQGGLIALNGLRYGQSVTIDSVTTLGGALGGIPEAAANFFIRNIRGICWDDPAVAEMEMLYNSTSQHHRQGSTATLRPFRANNNGLVQSAQSRGTRVMTIGSTDDCLYNPSLCDAGIFSIENTTTSVVEQADTTLLLSLGESNSLFNIFSSHRIVRQHPRVLDLISGFVKSSLIK